jgi:hypothetical protein
MPPMACDPGNIDVADDGRSTSFHASKLLFKDQISAVLNS